MRHSGRWNTLTVGGGGVVGCLDESVTLGIDIVDRGRSRGALVELVMVGLGESFVVVSLLFYLSQLEVCLFDHVDESEKSNIKKAQLALTSRTSSTRPRSFSVAAWVSSFRSRSASVSILD